MRKQMKIAAITSAAALLAIGASMTSFAKWVPVGDGTQMWVDNNGNPESGWHRYNGDYYCTDDDGHVITNSLISADGYVDDLAATTVYYVDAYGARTKNYWVSVTNEEEVAVNDTGEVDYIPETLYMYTGVKRSITKRTDGTNLAAKVNKTSSTTDTGIFVFNQDGYMMGGEVTAYDGTGDKAKTGEYYCVTLDDLADNLIELEEGTLAEKYVEGQALVGWAKFYVNDVAKDEDYVWHYYDNGKLVKPEAGKTQVTKTLSWQGKTSTFLFDVDGNLVMDSDVRYAFSATMPNATPPTATTGKLPASITFKNFNQKDGTLVLNTGWYSAGDIKGSDGVAEYYYIVNVIDEKHKLVKGVAFNADGGKKRAKLIDGKVFLFDTDGTMLYGRQEIKLSDFTDEAWYGITCVKKEFFGFTDKSKSTDTVTYFFNDKVNSGHRGEMETGRVTYTVGDIDVTSYVDPNKGLMKDAIIKDYYYDSDGYLYTALDDTYEFVPLDRLAAKITPYTVSGKTLTAGTPITVGSGVDGFIIVDRNGKVLKGSSTGTTRKIGDNYYKITGYVAKLVQ